MWCELAEEAGRQEAALRALITTGASGPDATTVNLADALRQCAAPSVSVAVPGHAVTVPARTANELCAAVRAALDNVTRHAGEGARSWVLLEQLAEEVRITVRDDGAGVAPGRLAEAEGQGRLGVVSSIRDRLVDLGGRAEVRSTPGQGPVVGLVVPYSERGQ